MGKLKAPCLAALCLLTLAPPATPAEPTTSCYQHSELHFFTDVVELVDWERNPQTDCWLVRLRLRGSESPQGHAMICKGNACSPRLPWREGIYWLQPSPNNENVRSVSVVESRGCTDVTFCIAPNDQGETMLVDFIALFEEGYFLPPTTFRPRWSHGVIDLSSLDGTKSHCQDGDPVPPPQRIVTGSICL